MRRLSLGIVLSVGLLVILVAPVAATTKQPTGNRINLFSGNGSYPASTAFHIRDGWLFQNPTAIEAIGKYTFTLDVDGPARAPDFRTTESFPDGSVARLWWFNFPNGMTGTHTFTGHFWGPCGASFPCNGQPSNTVVEQGTVSATVSFT